MKRIGWTALLLAALLCLFIPAAAEPQPWIQDDADLLTAEEEAQLYEDMLPLCEYGTPMFWSTYESGDYETLARNYYHRRLANMESGVLFVINMKARQLTVFSDGEINRTVTRAEAENITDNVFRMAGREEYYDCASSVFSQVGRLLAGERIARPMKLASSVLLALVLALMGVYLYIRWRYESRKEGGGKKGVLPVTAAAAAAVSVATLNNQVRMTKRKRTDISSHSGSGGGGHSGGGFSGGGGHSSGSGGSHGF